MLFSVIFECPIFPCTIDHRKKRLQNFLTSFTASVLAKTSFLCLVLLEDPESRLLAFRVGLYGLEMSRPPAACKSLEVSYSVVVSVGSKYIVSQVFKTLHQPMFNTFTSKTFTLPCCVRVSYPCRWCLVLCMILWGIHHHSIINV